MKQIQKIEISFPVAIDFPDEFEKELSSLIDTVCEKYEKEHTDRVMWPGEYGYKLISNPFMVADDEPLEFDENIYSVVVSEREDLHNRNKHKKGEVPK